MLVGLWRKTLWEQGAVSTGKFHSAPVQWFQWDLAGEFCNIISVLSRLNNPGENDLPRKEVSQVNKLAMSFILDVDNPPPVLPSTHGFAINDDTSFRANDGEWKHFLKEYHISYINASYRNHFTLTRSLSWSSSSSSSSESKGNILIWLWCISAKI